MTPCTFTVRRPSARRTTQADDVRRRVQGRPLSLDEELYLEWHNLYFINTLICDLLRMTNVLLFEFSFMHPTGKYVFYIIY